MACATRMGRKSWWTNASTSTWTAWGFGSVTHAVMQHGMSLFWKGPCVWCVFVCVVERVGVRTILGSSLFSAQEEQKNKFLKSGFHEEA